jgi:hypothetical protein
METTRDSKSLKLPMFCHAERNWSRSKAPHREEYGVKGKKETMQN